MCAPHVSLWSIGGRQRILWIFRGDQPCMTLAGENLGVKAFHSSLSQKTIDGKDGKRSDGTSLFRWDNVSVERPHNCLDATYVDNYTETQVIMQL